MRNIWKTLLLLCLVQTASAQGHPSLYVDGRTLKTKDGQAVILRGVNAGLAEDGNIDIADAARCSTYIDQVALTGANAIRFTWYTDGVSWRDGGQYVGNDPNPEARYHKGNGTVMKNYLENGHLGRIFAYCHSKNIIPVLSIHDLTCADDWNYFNQDFKAWWTRPSVVAFIQQHREYLIVNLANEMGHVQYAGGGQAARDVFKNNYNALVAEMRGLGVTVPIMVDAPDCGQSSSDLLQLSEDMQAADPAHNLLFSAHGYWSAYASTPAQIQVKLDEAVQKNVCFLMGEIANRQAGPPDYCGEIDISAIYPEILRQACTRQIGWLAWVWDQDCEPARMISTNGQFNSLTTYGNDIVNNAGYGLKSTGGCGASAPLLSVKEPGAAGTVITVYPNPASDFIRVVGTDAAGTASYSLADISGRTVFSGKYSGTDIRIPVSGMAPGSYILLKDGMPVARVTVNR